jgi:hypothetical protein
VEVAAFCMFALGAGAETAATMGDVSDTAITGAPGASAFAEAASSSVTRAFLRHVRQYAPEMQQWGGTHRLVIGRAHDDTKREAARRKVAQRMLPASTSRVKER